MMNFIKDVRGLEKSTDEVIEAVTSYYDDLARDREDPDMADFAIKKGAEQADYMEGKLKEWKETLSDTNRKRWITLFEVVGLTLWMIFGATLVHPAWVLAGLLLPIPLLLLWAHEAHRRSMVRMYKLYEEYREKFLLLSRSDDLN